MEIKATLNKPYEENQRIDFIIEQNHNKGYEIRETETALEAWGLDEEDLKKEEEKQKVAEAHQYLESTDYVAIKIAEGVATKEDYAEVLAKREEARALIRSLENG